VDTNWYIDSGVTDHITGELEKLTVRDQYMGGDQVHAANGSGMEIGHIGHSILQSPTNSLHLNNILDVPKASKSLVSVHHLAHDNDAYLEFHPDYFLSRNSRRTKSSTSADVKKVFTLSSHPSINRGLALQNHLAPYGTPDLVILPLPLFTRSSVAMPFRLSKIPITTCVMHVNKANIISCLILGLAVCPLVLWNLFFQMYGALPQF
jgi:hypothetical protein